VSDFSHLDEKGRAKMVDVSQKQATDRRARASCKLVMKKETLDLIYGGEIPKGDVFTTAKIAGIMAAKKTANLIPMCHPLNIAGIDIEFERLADNEMAVYSEVKLKGLTGAEMEALTACATAALTVYDMVKSKEKGIVITELMLLEKSGGKSGEWKSSIT